MKNILTAFVILTAFSLNAQTVNPGDKSIETKFITKESYRSKWFVVRDTLSHEIAEIITDVTPASDRLTIITEYKVKGAKSKWLDTTIVALPSLVPIHHSTTNQERDMMLDFGKDIKGYYYDKMTKKVTDIEQPVQDSFFFSGFYPYLIRLLPLKDGYTAELPLFDYKPLKNGVIKAFIQEVKSSTFRTKKNGVVDVWLVTVTEEVGGFTNIITYHIGKKDRILWRLDINTAMQKLLIRRME